MQPLKNIIIGFVDTVNEPSLTQAVTAQANSHLQTFSREEAEEEFTKTKGVLESVKRYVQRHIGGGPAEFLQDIRKMTPNDRLVTVHTADLSDTDSDELISQLLTNGVCRIKRFGKYCVEHVTHEDSHSAEIAAFGWVESEAEKNGWKELAPTGTDGISATN